MAEGALVNYNNYYVYASMVRDNQPYTLEVSTLSINNIDDHIEGIFNILKDGIETNFIHQCKIGLHWEPDIECRISIIDYWINLFMWSMIIKCGQQIRPKHIFLGRRAPIEMGLPEQYVPWELQRKDIQQYINQYILTLDNKINLGNTKLNIIIADGLHLCSLFEHFSYYLANTINNEDDIALMRACPEYDQIKHCSLQGVPFEQVKDEGMKITMRAIDIIKNSEMYIGYEHGLTNSFRANEAINPRQFKEAGINIGTKPTTDGGIFPYLIDKNFSSGGVNDPVSYYIESSTARTAQILSKINVGDSGELARILGLNNTDTVLNLEPSYECLSQHFIKFEIKSKRHLSMVKGRYFRFTPKGVDYIMSEDDTDLIGQTIYLHSPMTCASNSSGHGICRRCYGTLYWTNININVGKFAAENLSSKLTQILLSAKHLLETLISHIKWNPEFKDFFVLDINSIKISEDLIDDDLLSKYIIIIDPDSIQLVNDEEDAINVQESNSDDESEDEEMDEGFETEIKNDDIYNEYITGFTLRCPNGKEIYISSEEQTELYLSQYLNTQIRKKANNRDGKVNISLAHLIEDTLFYIKINNNEISKTMNDIINIINKSAITEKLSKDEALQELVDLIIAGNLDIDAIHLEVILSNQIVDAKNPLRKPNWNDPHVLYKMLTLNQALTNNPSVIISLLYKDLARVLYNPLTYSKRGPSFFDLFFNEQPQRYMTEELYTDTAPVGIRDLESRMQLYTVTDDNPDKSDEYLRRIEESPEYQQVMKEEGVTS